MCICGKCPSFLILIKYAQLARDTAKLADRSMAVATIGMAVQVTPAHLDDVTGRDMLVAIVDGNMSDAMVEHEVRYGAAALMAAANATIDAALNALLGMLPTKECN